jgi:hypothetical protein
VYTVPNVHIEQQVRNLNCGRYALEALLQWRHGCRFGRLPIPRTRHTCNRAHGSGLAKTMQFGPPRRQHAPAAREHIDDPRAVGFSPEDYLDDYGLTVILTPPTAQRWEDELREYGPIVVPGCIGAVEVLKRFGAGHYVLVVGVDPGSDELIYLDSLGSAVGGGLAFFGARHRNSDQQRRVPRSVFTKKIWGHSLTVSCKPVGQQNGPTTSS